MGTTCRAANPFGTPGAFVRPRPPPPNLEEITVPEASSLGLILSGGGAYGAAHVGVLRELRARGIRPGIVAGTSSGALVAAAYAADVPHERSNVPRVAFRWSSIARMSLNPRLGLLDTRALTGVIHRELGEDPLIERLPRRFAAVATDLRTRQAVVIDEGPLNVALRATIAVPGLLPPVHRRGQVLMDGGMTDNVPVGAARQLGASTVIVVRLHAKWENIRMMRVVVQRRRAGTGPDRSSSSSRRWRGSRSGPWPTCRI